MNSKKTLENALEIAKQWVPIKGMIRAYEKDEEGKLRIYGQNKIVLGIWGAYHLLSFSTACGIMSAGIFYGIKEIIEKV